MDETGLFPGIESMTPDMQAAITAVAQQTGIEVRQRCCMPELARSSECGWRHRPVTASIRGSLPGLTDSQVVDVYRKALSGWNSVCNTGLIWTDNFAGANIWAECKKIDGASGTLAWSYLVPCGGNSTNIRLEQRYDTSEKWSADWFLEVALHELGHALGLDHDTKNKAALMYPYSSSGRITLPTKFEIARVLPLYGPPVSASPSPGAVTIQGGVLLVNEGVAVDVAAGGNCEFQGRKGKVSISF